MMNGQAGQAQPGPAGREAIRPSQPSRAVAPAHPPRLLDQLREALQSRHYSRRTEQTYCMWVKRFIYFHHVRHPAEMAEPVIGREVGDLGPAGPNAYPWS